MKNEIILAIDLGTYLSSVSIFENGYPKIIPNDYGERFTLSCVSFFDTFPNFILRVSLALVK